MPDTNLRVVAFRTAVCEEDLGHGGCREHVDELAGQLESGLCGPIPEGLVVGQCLELLHGRLNEPWLVAPCISNRTPR